MDSLDVNGTCMTSNYKPQKAFLFGEIIQLHTIHESNYAVMKYHVIETVRQKKAQNTSLFWSYQAKLMW